MRAGFLAAAIAVVLALFAGPATAQEKNPVLEGAKKFCASEYGDRLLGVTLDGRDGFACRFAAVEKVATYKVAPVEEAPKWDLDEEAESTVAATAAASTAKLKQDTKAKLGKKKRSKRAKLRKRQGLSRKQKARARARARARAKKRDPFAEFMRKVRRAANRKRS